MTSIQALLVLTVSCLCLSGLTSAKPADHYTTKYDNIDLDEILNNDRLYNKYIDCLLDKGKCTPDGKTLRDVLPDALSNACSKCNEKQKSGADKVITFIHDKKPEDFKSLEAKYDPEGTYGKMYKTEAEKRGIKL